MIVCDGCQRPVYRKYEFKCFTCRPEKLADCPEALHGKKRIQIEQKEALVKVEIPMDSDRLDHVLMCHILKVIEKNNGNKVHAAKDLGISQKTIYNWLERFGLHTPGGVH